MDGASYIQWNLPNWITITLMALLGTVIFGALVAGVKQYKAG